MRKAHLTVMALAALATIAGASAIIAQPRSAGRIPLLPLSERDLRSTSESGCECTFRIGRSTLVRTIGNELTIRIRAGRQVCRITDAQFSALSNGRGTASCAGLRLSLRPTGPVTTHPESDSADGPAALSLSARPPRRWHAGRWGCAC